MRIENLFESPQISAISLTGKTGQEETATPSSRQRDTVSISSEARAAYEEARLAAPESAGRQNADHETGLEAEEENGAVKAFGDYMNKAKGNVGESGGTSIEEQIEALKKKLEKLQQNLAKTAQDGSLPDEVKNSRMQTINAEIEQITGQIAELMGQMAQQA